MSSTLDRLRRLHGLRPQKSADEVTSSAASSSRPTAIDPTPPTSPASTSVGAAKPKRRANANALETLIPGDEIENENGSCYVVTERYPLHELRGTYPLADLLTHHPRTFAAFHPTFGLQETIDFNQALFIDTETTGLGGGAGVYAFMVGVGTFETVANEQQVVDHSPFTLHPLPFTAPTHFVVRQYFMRNPAEEGALMMALAELLDSYGMSVTFNGRTFDLPLLRTRFRQNQHMYPELRGSGRLLDAERPHLDLLHPARRIWKRRLQSCRLINLEAEILGMQRTGDDVPGHLIPQLYTDYLRSGNAGQMSGIFYHNREDIVSMVALATHLSSVYQAGEEPTIHKLHGLDWLSLGRCYADQARWLEAERTFTAALEQLAGNPAQADAFAELAQLQKRQNRWDVAAETLQRWLSTVPGIDPTPYVELAKYCEWHCKDLEQAAMWTQWALHNLQSAPAWQRSGAQVAELEYRLARIQRKQK
ncbi:MAG: ribonuclease H-like domain-containing protein [Caldilineaceae bacterium]